MAGVEAAAESREAVCQRAGVLVFDQNRARNSVAFADERNILASVFAVRA